MSLPHSVLSGHQLTRKLPTTSGHACLTQGNSRDIRYAAHPGTSFAAALIRCGGIGIARAFSACEVAGMGGQDGLRSQPLRAFESREPAAPAPFLFAVSCPSHLSDVC